MKTSIRARQAEEENYVPNYGGVWIVDGEKLGDLEVSVCVSKRIKVMEGREITEEMGWTGERRSELEAVHRQSGNNKPHLEQLCL